MKRWLPFLLLVVPVVATCGSPAAATPPISPFVSPSVAPSGSSTLAPTASLEPSPSRSTEPAVAARAYIVALSSLAPRLAGTDAEKRAAAYIADTLRAAGYEPETRAFTAKSWDGRRINSANVVAVKAGRSSREIVVGAHYDSVSQGLGADDNASGVAVLLELANLLVDEPTPYTVRFVAFGAEEIGFLGSNHFVAHMSAAERANVVAMVNLDSVVAGDYQYLYSAEGQAAAARDWVLAWASARDLDLRTIRDVDLYDSRGEPHSDYGAFHAAGIPFVYLEATNWTVGAKDGWTQMSTQYGRRGVIRHTSADTLAWLDATFPGRVDDRLNLSVSVIRALLTEYMA